MENEESQTGFPLKEKNPYPSCKIYEGVWSCKENYIGESKRNVVTRWSEHENLNKDSEPTKNLFQQPDHVSQWKGLKSAPMNNHNRKNLEAFFIAVKDPTLNEHKDSKTVRSFRNSVTWYIVTC